MPQARGWLVNNQAILDVGLQSFVPDYATVADGAPIHIPIIAYRGLIDTGAQRTCISYKAIHENGLQAQGRKMIHSVGGARTHKTYLVHVGFWYEGNNDLDSEPLRSYFGMPDALEVIDIFNNHSFDLIIGMDILSRCELTFRKSGEFILEF
jgi:hypothetical protein